MELHYTNANNKKYYGAAAYNHYIKENGGFKKHNQKMATYGALHPELFLSLAKQFIVFGNSILKITSKKNKNKR